MDYFAYARNDSKIKVMLKIQNKNDKFTCSF